MSSEAKEQEKIDTREARGLAKKQGILAAHNARPTLQAELLELIRHPHHAAKMRPAVLGL